ncbi:hypothetical protein ACO0R3_003945 [Hanseniaspora guilliermondii]
MQYFGKALGSVTKSWSAINPATLSGAVDVIVVEHADGELSCSPFHVRFGKFQVLKPAKKKVDVYVNGQETTIPMKLNEYGEAQFVFEFLGDNNGLPADIFAASPVTSVASSPVIKPDTSVEEPDFLDINRPYVENGQGTTNLDPENNSINSSPQSPRFKPIEEKLAKIKIPTKVDNFTGDLLLDIEGYKSNKHKIHDSDELVQQILKEEFGEDMLDKILEKDSNGNIRIINLYDDNHDLTSSNVESKQDGNISVDNGLDNKSDSYENSQSVYDPGSPRSINSDSTFNSIDTSTATSIMGNNASLSSVPESERPKKYIKTIRLTSDQLQCLNLKHGVNNLKFVIDKGTSVLEARLFLWKWDTPIVISDIDGTITKSDAMGHVMAMIGKDWTHPGVAKLFTDIEANGYNIMYLTARSAGLADSTRQYLKSINQDGFLIPDGPVILSPDRTFTALKREVILKKPEVFKMACLNDIRKLYLKNLSLEDDYDYVNKFVNNPLNGSSGVFDDDMPTPFIAGFGNRITDGISYRSVGIPRSRIFTINPYGEVHMELLEMSGYKSSYLFINELVDHFFPPVVNYGKTLTLIDEKSQSDIGSIPLISKSAEVLKNKQNKANEELQTRMTLFRNKESNFSDTNYWREPLPDISDLSEDSDVEESVKSRGQEVTNRTYDTSVKNRTTPPLTPSLPSTANSRYLTNTSTQRESKSTGSLPTGADGMDYNTSDIQKSAHSRRSSLSMNKVRSNSISHQRTKSNDSRFFSWVSGRSDHESVESLQDDDLSPFALNRSMDKHTDGTNMNSPKEFGKRLYLDLNSPISSPKRIFSDDDSIHKDHTYIPDEELLNSLDPQPSNNLVFNHTSADNLMDDNDEFDEDDEFEI